MLKMLKGFVMGIIGLWTVIATAAWYLMLTDKKFADDYRDFINTL